MGTAHKVISACLRVFEFGCSVIILGILARFFYRLNRIDGPTDSRLVYAITIAAISVTAAIMLVPPVKYSFYCFPLDLALFVCWIVCFALLEDVSEISDESPRCEWPLRWTNSTAAHRSKHLQLALVHGLLECLLECLLEF